MGLGGMILVNGGGYNWPIGGEDAGQEPGSKIGFYGVWMGVLRILPFLLTYLVTVVFVYLLADLLLYFLAASCIPAEEVCTCHVEIVYHAVSFMNNMKKYTYR